MEKLVSVSDFRDFAHAHLDANAWNYFEDGATEQTTFVNNMAAFQRYRLMPNYMVNVSSFQPSVTVFGRHITTPVGFAPTAFQRWAHPEGELASARAAEAMGAIFIHSASSSSLIEDVATAAPRATKWQQIYPWALRDETLRFIRRAEAAGFAGIVVTIDRPVGSIRYNAHRGLASIPAQMIDVNFSNSTMAYQMKLVNAAQSWEDLAWIKRHTSLPVIVKGLLNSRQVARAVDAGVDGILVSNHGGRVLDGVPASIDVLGSIVEAAKDTNLEIFMDGGIRTGADVFKAIAMGARMVFVGRPLVYGLANSGEQGARHILEILTKQFINTAQLCGAPSMESINKHMVLSAESKI